MQTGKIAEIRGISYKQNLDPYMGDVLAKKLDEFPDKDEYLKKDTDMKKLTEIDNKTKQDKTLTKDDLIFLYEIDAKIDGFGYQRDPRIAEIIAGRNPREDAPIVLECQSNQIAYSQAEYEEAIKDNKKIKAYIGPLFVGIFSKNLEHIYTAFPEGRIEQAEMAISHKSKEKIMKELDKRTKLADSDEEKVYVYDYAKSMLSNPEFTVAKKSEQINLVRLKVEIYFLRERRPKRYIKKRLSSV